MIAVQRGGDFCSSSSARPRSTSRRSTSPATAFRRRLLRVRLRRARHLSPRRVRRRRRRRARPRASPRRRRCRSSPSISTATTSASRSAITMGEGGIAPFTLKLPPYARTGHHRIDVIAGKDVIGTYRFQVEEFVPDRIKVEIAPEEEGRRAGRRSRSTTSPAPISSARPRRTSPVDTRVRLVPVELPRRRGSSGFTFSNDDRKFDAREIANDSGTLDAKGAQRVQASRSRRRMLVPSSLEAHRHRARAGAGRPRRLRRRARSGASLVRLRRRAAAGREGLSGRRQAGRVRVGVGVEGRQAGEERRAARGALRGPVAHGAAEDLERRLRLRDARATRSCSRRRRFPPARRAARSRSSPSGYRTYRVVVTDPASGASAQTDFCAGGWGYSPWAMKNPGRLQLDLDKDRVRAGRRGHRCRCGRRSPGKLLVTVERDEVHVRARRDADRQLRRPSRAADRGAPPERVRHRDARPRRRGTSSRARRDARSARSPINVDREANRLASRDQGAGGDALASQAAGRGDDGAGRGGDDRRG